MRAVAVAAAAGGLFDAFAAVAADIHLEVEAAPEAEIETELLALAFRYFRSQGQRR